MKTFEIVIQILFVGFFLFVVVMNVLDCIKRHKK